MHNQEASRLIRVAPLRGFRFAVQLRDVRIDWVFPEAPHDDGCDVWGLIERLEDALHTGLQAMGPAWLTTTGEAQRWGLRR